MRLDTVEFIFQQLNQAYEAGMLENRFTFFETVLYFIDSLIFENGLRELMNERRCSLVIRKLEFRSSRFPTFLTKNKNTYLFSIEKKFYQAVKKHIYAFIAFTQFFIVEFVMALFGKLETSRDFTCQGKFFMCLMNRLFSINKNDQNFLMEYRQSEQPYIPILMENWSASCFMDSLLTIILLGDCENIRISILKEKEFNFETEGLGFHNPTTYAITDTNDKAVKYAMDLRNQLKLEYKTMLGMINIQHHSYRCKTIRDIFFETNPSMKKKGNWIGYSSDELYGTLIQLFPKLKQSIPIIYADGRESFIDFDSFYMQEYLLDDYDENAAYKIVWEKIDAPFLVFKNSMSPRFPDYAANTAISEAYIPENQNPAKVNRVELPVKNWFGEYIINDRYRLFGVNIHYGSIDDASSHYTAFIRPFFDTNSWFFYNDIKNGKHPTFTHYGKRCPADGYKDDGDAKPEMFFYTRVY